MVKKTEEKKDMKEAKMYADTFTKTSNMWVKSGVRSASAYPGKYTTLRDGSSIYHPRQLKQNPNLGTSPSEFPQPPSLS